MAGKTSHAMREALRLVVNHGETPFRAARRQGINPATMYRSALYKAWRDGLEHPELTEIRDSLRTVINNRIKR